MIVKIFNLDPSSFKIVDVDVVVVDSMEQAKTEIMTRHYHICFENMDTELELDEFLSQHSYEDTWNNNEFYDTFEFDIE